MDNNKDDKEDLAFNDDTRSGLYRCRGCNCAIFSLHKQQIVNEKTNTSTYEIISDCCECLGSTRLLDLRERYNDYDNEDDKSGNSITSIKFKESQLLALDNFLDIMKKQFASIVNNSDNTKISESEKKKYKGKLVQVENLMALIKSTAHD